MFQREDKQLVADYIMATHSPYFSIDKLDLPFAVWMAIRAEFIDKAIAWKREQSDVTGRPKRRVQDDLEAQRAWNLEDARQNPHKGDPHHFPYQD